MKSIQFFMRENKLVGLKYFVSVCAVIVLLIACFALVGCGNTNARPASSTSSAAANTNLKIGVVSLSDADALDPANASTTGGYIFAKQVFDTLCDYGTDGKWYPRLAESVEKGDTADKWTVKLRDAKWHDGKPVKASDVVYTVNRWFDEGLPPAESLSYIDPAQVKAIDDKTVEFTLKQPVALFPEALSSPLCAIVPEGFDVKKPVGSGPFVYDTVNPAVQMTFNAFDDYWGKVPEAKELIITSFADTTSEANALLSGQIDMAASFDSTLADMVKSKDGFKVFDYPTSGALSWAMNCEQAPLNDPAVRKALRLAVDRQELVDNVYGGYATVANDYWSPYDENYTKDLAQRTYNPEEAKKILTDAGYQLPVRVELWGCPNQPTSDRQNTLLVEQAKKAGFDINFNKVDSATFYGDAYGTYPLSLSYWGFLNIFDQAAMTITKDAPYNSTHWIDDEYEALYKQAVAAEDEATRKALVAKMQAIEYDRGSYIVPIFMNTLVAHSDKIGGLEAYPNTDGALGYNFNTITLS